MRRLEAIDLSIERGGRRILDGVSAAFTASGVTAVIGPNGAGKSTLLLALAGLIAPSAGGVQLDGAPIGKMNKRSLARVRAYLPQNARCEWAISVENVVALGLTPTLPLFGDLPAAEKARVEAMLTACDLTTLRAQAATTLSGGELARTMLARAMIGEPEILLTDEPVAGLDPRHALDAMRRLRALGDDGRIVVVALHDLALAARYADRVIALANGKIVADGAWDDVLKPETLRALYDVDVHVERDERGYAIYFIG
jgi:iron complex transport system ATP-binding protein